MADQGSEPGVRPYENNETERSSRRLVGAGRWPRRGRVAGLLGTCPNCWRRRWGWDVDPATVTPTPLNWGHQVLVGAS